MVLNIRQYIAEDENEIIAQKIFHNVRNKKAD